MGEEKVMPADPATVPAARARAVPGQKKPKKYKSIVMKKRDAPDSGLLIFPILSFSRLVRELTFYTKGAEDFRWTK